MVNSVPFHTQETLLNPECQALGEAWGQHKCPDRYGPVSWVSSAVKGRSRSPVRFPKRTPKLVGKASDHLLMDGLAVEWSRSQGEHSRVRSRRGRSRAWVRAWQEQRLCTRQGPSGRPGDTGVTERPTGKPCCWWPGDRDPGWHSPTIRSWCRCAGVTESPLQPVLICSQGGARVPAHEAHRANPHSRPAGAKRPFSSANLLEGPPLTLQTLYKSRFLIYSQ